MAQALLEPIFEQRFRRAEPSRGLWCLVLAGGLHAAALLFGPHWHRLLAASESLLAPVSPSAPDEVQVSVDEPAARSAGSLPGGGAAVPEARAKVSAPEQPVKPVLRAPPVQRAPELKERPSVTENLDRGAPELGAFPADLLASDQGEEVDLGRPHAARRQLLEDRPQAESATAPHAAQSTASSSHSQGEGFGVNGGPGGTGHGRGSGVIEQRFAFGGPSGAFRADVCFIERTVQHLTDITTCVPVATFFTNVLNVSPRRFDAGFPGLGPRTEWFAIKYRGEFSVEHEDAYTFRLLSDDGALLQIDGHTVLDNDGQHLPQSVSSNIRLAAGKHAFYVFYYQGPPAFLALQLFVKRFDHPEELFTPNL